MIHQSIDDRLKELRLSLNLTQKEMSERLDMRQSYYSDLENGKRNISGKLIEKLSKIFSVSPNWMYTGEGDKLLLNSNYNIAKSVYVDVTQKRNIDDLRLNNELSLSLLNHIIQNSIQILKFYCRDLIGRIGLNELGDDKRINQIVLAARNEGQVIDNKYGYTNPQKFFDSDEFNSVDDKILLIDQLNTDIIRYLDFVWEYEKFTRDSLRKV